MCGQQQDYDFLVGMMKIPQVGRIDNKIDCEDVERQGRYRKRKQSIESYYNRNRLDTSVSSEPDLNTSSITPSKLLQALDPSDIIGSKLARTDVSYPDTDSDSDSDDNDSEGESLGCTPCDSDYIPPLRYTRSQTRRPDTVSINLPTRTIPEMLARTSTTIRTSIRQELKTSATMLQGGGASILDVTMSISTIHRNRKKKIKTDAESIKKAFKRPDFGVLHFDGKIVQYADGSKEDRIATVLSAPNETKKQFLLSGITRHTRWDWGCPS